MIGLVKAKKLPLYCSFCGKNKDEVGYLVAGPTVFICNECVELCREIGTTMLVESAPPAPTDRENRLRDALSQLVGWVEECGSGHEGRDYCLTESRAALRGFTVIQQVP